MTDPQSSLKNYCNQFAVSEKSVFMFVFPELSRALSEYQRYKKTGDVPERVKAFMRDHDKQMHLFENS